MWGAFNALAEKAKAAAADLEGQINESVGIVEPKPTAVTPAKTETNASTVSGNDNDDDDDDVWKDDDFDIDGIDSAPPLPSQPANDGHKAASADTKRPPSETVQEATVDVFNESNHSNTNNVVVDDDGLVDAPDTKSPEDPAEPDVPEDGAWAGEDDLEFDETEQEVEEEEQEQVSETKSTEIDETPSPTLEEELPETSVSKTSEPEPEVPAVVDDDPVTAKVEAAESKEEPPKAEEIGEEEEQHEDGWQEDLVIDDSEQPVVEDDTKDDDMDKEVPLVEEALPSDEKESVKPSSCVPDQEILDSSPSAEEMEETKSESINETESKSVDTDEVPQQQQSEEPDQPTIDTVEANQVDDEQSQISQEESPEMKDAKSAVNSVEEDAEELKEEVATSVVEENVVDSEEKDETTPADDKESETDVNDAIALKESNSFDLVESNKSEASDDIGRPDVAESVQDHLPTTESDSQPTTVVVERNGESEAVIKQKEKIGDNGDAENDPMAEANTNSKHVSEETSVEPQSGEKQTSAEQERALEQYRQLVEQLQTELQQREAQLFSKTEQLTSMETMFEAEKLELVQIIENTKIEAKRRIQLAKERVEKAEAHAAQLSRGQSEDAQKQAQIISELRSEGEKLAHKQAEMERAVRSAKGEARKLREALEMEQVAKDEALDTIDQLQIELKTAKEQLNSARKGEAQATKLESELQSSREDAERKASTILSLEQQVKELKSEAKDLMTELEAARKGAAIETEREQKKLRKEQSNLIDDFEAKLRIAEKEAAVREDALRTEVSELRKRWQDAVRRADSLSMDVQSSTAPLMRQLESMERQNRARAAAWSELETKLREELEETVIANEKLTKEKSEMKIKLTRMERTSKESEIELRQAQNELEEKIYKVKELEDKLVHLEEEGAKKQKEWADIERLANEGVARVRSEMSQTMLEADERHRGQVDSLKAELKLEREKRIQLEQQVQDLVDKAGAIVPKHVPMQAMHRANSAPTPKLRKSEEQAEILAGALSGLSDDSMDEEDDDDDDDVSNHGGTSSFAALEELTSRLKSTKVELNTLRKSLAESEKTRAKLMDELSEARNAREKLPLFEARVKELTAENEQMSLEIQGLQADIADVRELYRTQLNALLEEKASLLSNGGSAENSMPPPQVEPSEASVEAPSEILEI